MNKLLYISFISLLLASSFAFGQSKTYLPIMSWWSITPENATPNRYQELKDCGFNVSFSAVYDDSKALEMLDMAGQCGMKVMFMCPSLSSDPERTVAKVKKHPALYGYFLRDEPGNDALDDLGTWAHRIMNADPKHPCYLNLLPSHAFPSADAYREHLHLFSQKVGIQMLSFDNYPVHSHIAQITDEGGNQASIWRYNYNWSWYENLKLIAEEAQRTNVPFWGFALATAHADYPIPQIGFLRLQMYSNLAYGAQGLQYFTYWNPTTETWDFHHAPITLQGKRSYVYDIVREMNQELQNRAFVFVNGKVTQVNHLWTGGQVPPSNDPLTELPNGVSSLIIGQLPSNIPIDSLPTLASYGGGLVVSQITNNNHRYLVLVNTSLTNKLPLRIRFNKPTKRIRKDGTLVDASLYETEYLMDEGYCEIFQMD